MDTSDHRYPLLFCKWYWWRFNLNWKKRIPIKIIILTCTMYGAPASVPLSIQWKKYLNVCVRACVYVHVWVTFSYLQFCQGRGIFGLLFSICNCKKTYCSCTLILLYYHPCLRQHLSDPLPKNQREKKFHGPITSHLIPHLVLFYDSLYFTFHSTFSVGKIQSKLWSEPDMFASEANTV